MKQLICSGMVAMMLVGCAGMQSRDPYTGEDKVSNTTKGAGIGALTGAILGAAVSSKKDRKKGAVIGALVGGATGGGIGYYMDQQEAALRQRLEGTGVRVQRIQGTDEIRLIMPGSITFKTNSSDISGNFYSTLNSVGLVLQECDKTSINVIGFTDSTGSFEHNQELSERRAKSVAQYLSGRGVVRNRIQSNGRGERDPIASNDSASGRTLNRRVEINIRSSGA